MHFTVKQRGMFERTLRKVQIIFCHLIEFCALMIALAIGAALIHRLFPVSAAGNTLMEAVEWGVAIIMLLVMSYQSIREIAKEGGDGDSTLHGFLAFA
jgi:fucose 4-O-acetylase-like acetyltransferase